MSDKSGTIDITSLVESMRFAFVDWAQGYLWALILAVPGLGWLAGPILKTLFGKGLQWLLNRLSESTVMLGFFLNTAIRKGSQASDFVNAVEALHKLPETASEEDYAKAEQNKITAFERFAIATN